MHDGRGYGIVFARFMQLGCCCDWWYAVMRRRIGYIVHVRSPVAKRERVHVLRVRPLAHLVQVRRRRLLARLIRAVRVAVPVRRNGEMAESKSRQQTAAQADRCCTHRLSHMASPAKRIRIWRPSSRSSQLALTGLESVSCRSSFQPANEIEYAPAIPAPVQCASCIRLHDAEACKDAP